MKRMNFSKFKNFIIQIEYWCSQIHYSKIFILFIISVRDEFIHPFQISGVI